MGWNVSVIGFHQDDSACNKLRYFHIKLIYIFMWNIWDVELLLWTEQVASLHRSVAFCESEGCDTALFVRMGDFPVTFFVSGCISVQEKQIVNSGMACGELHLLSLT